MYFIERGGGRLFSPFKQGREGLHMWKRVAKVISLMLIGTIFLMACGMEDVETGEVVEGGNG